MQNEMFEVLSSYDDKLFNDTKKECQKAFIEGLVEAKLGDRLTVKETVGGGIYSVITRDRIKRLIRDQIVTKTKDNLIVEIERVARLDLDAFVKRAKGDKKAQPVWIGPRMRISSGKEESWKLSLQDILPFTTEDATLIESLTGLSMVPQEKVFDRVMTRVEDWIVPFCLSYIDRHYADMEFGRERCSYSVIQGELPKEQVEVTLFQSGYKTKVVLKKKMMGYSDVLEVVGNDIPSTEVNKKVPVDKLIKKILRRMQTKTIVYEKEQIAAFFA